MGVVGSIFFAIAAIRAKQAAEKTMSVSPNRSPGRLARSETAERTSAKPVSKSDFVLPSNLKRAPSEREGS